MILRLEINHLRFENWHFKVWSVWITFTIVFIFVVVQFLHQIFNLLTYNTWKYWVQNFKYNQHYIFTNFLILNIKILNIEIKISLEMTMTVAMENTVMVVLELVAWVGHGEEDIIRLRVVANFFGEGSHDLV